MSASDRTEQLLDVAEELFADRGYADVSIEEIARAAGVTRPVVYERLGTRSAAYLAVVGRARAELEERMIAAALAHEEPEAQLRAGCRSYFAYLQERPRRWMILYGSATGVGGDVGRDVTEARFATVDRIADLLHPHLRRSGRDVDEEFVTALSHQVSGAVEQLGRWWMRHPEVPLDRVVEHLMSLAWHGLGRLVED